MTSKFKGILDRAKDREPAVAPEEKPVTPTPPSPAPKKRGRPSGKRSDADYVQVTAYIEKSHHRAVKMALLKADEDTDFSDLVNILLGNWLESGAEIPRTQKSKLSKS
jgi:hypothetical protein